MSNRLIGEGSPYLLQHALNPVDWYPWCDEAFERAKREDKPIFLSIGYSTCHWCHVMARESFEDGEIAAILNEHFISVKVDREERPDIDSIYMRFCQAFTGSGGWPTSVFMTPEKEPFFAGTYFPSRTRGGIIGFKELIGIINEQWKGNRKELIAQAKRTVEALRTDESASACLSSEGLLERAVECYKKSFDAKNGGFGVAPKFPCPHNLWFLLGYYDRYGDSSCLKMVEKTLTNMYKGGLFDHVGYGFSRYSTDKYFLVPHFEKMLYDNALLIIAYVKCYFSTGNGFYLDVARKTIDYVFRELTSREGGFYSAQDADSGGEEGKYYLFTDKEISSVLGAERGALFNKRYGITPGGNFEGKSIPNMLYGNPNTEETDIMIPKLYEYRKGRHELHLDDKILTSWNSFMIAAACELYRATGEVLYLNAAKKANCFIMEKLMEGDTLYVGISKGRRGAKGFLDDYAAYVFANLYLYNATLDAEYLDMAKRLTEKAISVFKDKKGGFFMSGRENERLIIRPKELYDGAVPSGNSLMAFNLVRLMHLTGERYYELEAKTQLDFIYAAAEQYPTGYGAYLTALLDYYSPPMKVTVVEGEEGSKKNLPRGAIAYKTPPTDEYPLKNGRTTYYVCVNNACRPPTNDISTVN